MNGYLSRIAASTLQPAQLRPIAANRFTARREPETEWIATDAPGAERAIAHASVAADDSKDANAATMSNADRVARPEPTSPPPPTAPFAREKSSAARVPTPDMPARESRHDVERLIVVPVTRRNTPVFIEQNETREPRALVSSPDRAPARRPAQTPPVASLPPAADDIVHIHIGRIDVRAMTPAPTPARARRTPVTSALDAHLRDRDGGRA